MIPAHPNRFGGIFPSTILPMGASEAPDWNAYALHTAACGLHEGIAGILCNGHAGENFTLEPAEKSRAVAETVAVAGRTRLVVAGVNQEASAAAAREAAAAVQAGADAVMVVPPNGWALTTDPAVPLRHHQAICAAIPGIPVFLFVAHHAAGGVMAYPPAVLDALVDLRAVVGIKEGGWEVNRYDALRRRIKRRRPEIAVLASGDEHLLACMVHGSEGSMVSLAALVPEVVVALDAAARTGDLDAARLAHAKLEPLAQAIYGDAPSGRATARLKHCLWVLGRIPSAACRAPLGIVDAPEAARLTAALQEAGAV
jgi:4-hydroxy-tetrahydrodipicolinate synthase